MGSVTRELKNILTFLITLCLLGIVLDDSYISYMFFHFVLSLQKVDQLEVYEHLIEANDITFHRPNDFYLCLNCIELMRPLLLITGISTFVSPFSAHFEKCNKIFI